MKSLRVCIIEKGALAVLTGAALVLAGCGKKTDESVSADPEPAPEAAAQPQEAAAEGQGTADVSQQIKQAEAALQKSDYETAVDSLLQARRPSGQMSEKDAMAYHHQMQLTIDQVLRNADTDPRAARARETLSRFANGR